MPYASDKQRKYLHAKKPSVAAKFDRDIKAGKGKAIVRKAAKPIKSTNKRRGSK